MALNWFKRKDADARPPNAAGAPAGEPAEAAPPTEQNLFSRLKRGLNKTHNRLVDGLRSAVGLKAKLDEETLERIEEILIEGDAGAKAAGEIIARVRAQARELREISPDTAMELVKDAVVNILSVNQRELNLDRPAPLIMLMVGVNGAGKTTTIGKLALEMTRAGKTVVLAAGDTFRAAAIEQLEIWAKRSGAGFVGKEQGSDPAAVCFEVLDAARKDPPDVVMIDTAGRLHNKAHLMDELAKMIRVIKKIYPDAPHEILLTLDATTGQNVVQQVKTFNDLVKVTGLIITKLDGTAKGGALLAVKESVALPVYKIGVGEAPEDLQDFDPERFADALFEDADDGPEDYL